MRVLDVLMRMFCLQFGCEPEEVELAATLDDLNIAPHEREHMALVLEEMYGIAIDGDTLDGFETVEDVVAYIEDRLN
ncbi:MAG: hypothetical protein E7527_02535 [Ruminococcaceae bacterium]|nr:hypothetical protein [Oscillospiraceae bacterium]